MFPQRRAPNSKTCPTTQCVTGWTAINSKTSENCLWCMPTCTSEVCYWLELENITWTCMKVLLNCLWCNRHFTSCYEIRHTIVNFLLELPNICLHGCVRRSQWTACLWDFVYLNNLFSLLHVFRYMKLPCQNTRTYNSYIRETIRHTSISKLSWKVCESWHICSVWANPASIWFARKIALCKPRQS